MMGGSETSDSILGRSALLSAGIHVSVLALALFGVLDYKTDVVDMAQPMPVELVTEIDEVSQSTDPATPTKENKPQKEPKVEDVPESVPAEKVPEKEQQKNNQKKRFRKKKWKK